MRVIPAIDLLNGVAVRLRHGRFDAVTRFATDPIAPARRLVEAGIRELHVVDLDGARSGRPEQTATVAAIARLGDVRLQAGGGIRSLDDARLLLDAGATRVLVGSALLADVTMLSAWLDVLGPERVVGCLDAVDGSIAIDAWRTTTESRVDELARRLADIGLRSFLSTDIGRDGTMQGPSLPLYAQLRAALPDAELIASGGIASLRDLERLAAEGLDAAVVGSAWLTGVITPEELARWSPPAEEKQC